MAPLPPVRKRTTYSDIGSDDLIFALFYDRAMGRVGDMNPDGAIDPNPSDQVRQKAQILLAEIEEFKLKHGKHDQSTHGRKGRAGKAGASAYAAARSNGASHQEALGAAKQATAQERTAMRAEAAQRRVQSLQKQAERARRAANSGEVTDAQRAGLLDKANRLEARARGERVPVKNPGLIAPSAADRKLADRYAALSERNNEIYSKIRKLSDEKAALEPSWGQTFNARERKRRETEKERLQSEIDKLQAEYQRGQGEAQSLYARGQQSGAIDRVAVADIRQRSVEGRSRSGDDVYLRSLEERYGVKPQPKPFTPDQQARIDTLADRIRSGSVAQAFGMRQQLENSLMADRNELERTRNPDKRDEINMRIRVAENILSQTSNAQQEIEARQLAEFQQRRARQSAAQSTRQAAAAQSARNPDQIAAAGERVGSQARKMTATEQKEIFGHNVAGRGDVSYNPQTGRYRVSFTAGFGGDYEASEFTPAQMNRLAAAGVTLTRETVGSPKTNRIAGARS